MKVSWHLAITTVGALLFLLMTVATSGVVSNEPKWYQLPVFVAGFVGVLAGRGGDDINAFVVYFVWALECLAAGVLLDLVVVVGMRWRMGFKKRIEGAKPKGSVR